MSKIHKLQVDAYKARIYIKGTGRILAIPNLVEKKLEKEEGIKEGKTFLTETVTDLSFEQPNKYEQTILSSRTSEFESNSSVSPMDFVRGSFYDPKINGTISPLSPSAFAYYRFELESTFKDQGYEVSKIKVTPRSKGEDVWEGYINIVEDRWCIHSLQLNTIKFAFDIQVQQTHAVVQENVFMPVSHQMKITGKIFGFKIEYNYVVVVNDYDIKVNPKYNQEIKLIDEKIERERAKDAKKAQQEKGKNQDLATALSSGQELTRKNLRQLMKEVEKQEREEARQKTKKGEIPESELIRNETKKTDSLASKRAKDDSFWNENRTVALSEFEMKAYQERDSTARMDSIKKANPQDSLAKKDKKRNRTGKFQIYDVLFGDSYKVGKLGTFSIGNILKELNYNTVEGFNGNYRLSYLHQLKKTRSNIRFTALGRYAVSRELFSGKGEIDWKFYRRFRYDTLQIRETNWKLDGGRFVEQFNTEYPIEPILNTFTTLLSERNYMKIYERDYVRLRWNSTFSEALKAEASLEYAHRRELQNNTDFRIIDRPNIDFTPNLPENVENNELAFGNYNALVFQTKLTYKPFHSYAMVCIMAENTW
jgi:hypothetical protein